MDNQLTFTQEPASDVDYETAVAQMFAEMQRLNQQIQDDHQAIAQITEDTRTLKIEAGRLQAEGQALQAETRLLLDRLRTIVYSC